MAERLNQTLPRSGLLRCVRGVSLVPGCAAEVWGVSMIVCSVMSPPTALVFLSGLARTLTTEIGTRSLEEGLLLSLSTFVLAQPPCAPVLWNIRYRVSREDFLRECQNMHAVGHPGVQRAGVGAWPVRPRVRHPSLGRPSARSPGQCLLFS